MCPVCDDGWEERGYDGSYEYKLMLGYMHVAAWHGKKAKMTPRRPAHSSSPTLARFPPPGGGSLEGAIRGDAAATGGMSGGTGAERRLLGLAAGGLPGTEARRSWLRERATRPGPR